MKSCGRYLQLAVVLLLMSNCEWVTADEDVEFNIKKRHKSFQTDESKARRRKLFNEEIETAVTRGLKYLLDVQEPDGFFTGSSNYRDNVATAAFAGHALLMAGKIWKDADYQLAVDKTAAYLISQQTDSGLILKDEKQRSSALYGHGIALRFLAKYYSSNKSDELRTAINRAAALSVSLQQGHGAWGYEFQPGRLGRGDVSNTACQIAALIAARDAGFDIDDKVYALTAAYFKNAQKEDGGFLYVLRYDSGSTYQRSAAVMASWPQLPGVEATGLVKAYAFMDQKHKPNHTNFPFYHYSMTYGIEAYRHRGSDEFCRWYEAVSKPLLSQQSSDGSWNVNHVRLGKTFGTATVCMTLQSVLLNPGSAKSIKR